MEPESEVAFFYGPPRPVLRDIPELHCFLPINADDVIEAHMQLAGALTLADLPLVLPVIGPDE